MSTQLDANQAIRAAFDDPTQSLKVLGTFTASIVISDTTDSIKIGNGSGMYAGVTSNGLNTYEVTRGSSLSANSIPVVIASDQSTVPTKLSTPTPGTITSKATTVGTSAVRLTVSGSAPSATRSVLVATIDSSSTGKFYIGPSTVTSSGVTRGIQVQSGQAFIANNDAGDYWIISDTAAQTVEIMEQQ